MVSRIPSVQAVAEITAHVAKKSLSFFRNPLRQKKRYKSDSTPVTEADLLINRELSKALATHWPHIPYIGEEGARGIRTGGFWWCVDEIDGTSPFTMGIPEFVTMVALMEDDRVRLSVIYEPVMQRLFCAEHGKGATCNGAPIRVQAEDKTAGIIAFASWPGQEAVPGPFNLPRILHDRGHRLMSLGSIGYMDTLVARGAIAASIFPGATLHDTAPGDLLVREAGGVTCDVLGRPLTYAGSGTPGHVYARSGTVRDGILDALSR